MVIEYDKAMKKIFGLLIVVLITTGVLVQINPIFAPSHPVFAGQNMLVFYGKGTTDQSSPMPDEVIRTVINKDTATIVHPAKGIEIIRMNIQTSDACIQTQATVCFDGIVTDTRNVDVHKIGDKIGITFDFQNKKQIISFDSGLMQGVSFTVDLSKTIIRLDGPLTVTLAQEGGFAGVQNTFVVDMASAQLTKNDSIIMLDEDSISEITSLIKKIKLFDVDEETYPPIEGSADYFTYFIQISHGQIQKTVSWTDTSEIIPEKMNALKDVIIKISSNIQTSEPAPDILQAELAIDFVKNAPTFAFDGMGDSLTVEDVMILESFPVQYVVTINFESLHGGYGDRTGQYLTQAITPHTIIVTVVDGQITSAIIDDIWDELSQETIE
ncbi:MAG TPA: hypothetical protein VGA92_00800 [Candidatus Nitrosotenuis sp.]